jgi:hypothetical protein
MMKYINELFSSQVPSSFGHKHDMT